MSTMSREEAREFLQKVFANMFDPQTAAESLSEFFATDYVQDADGAQLNFNGFIDHARVLKNTFRSDHVRFEEILVDGPKIADVHIVDARKADGDTIRVKVIALYTLENGEIVRVDELTHLLKGAEADRDIGFRTSH
jgi:ketosteroid isomerase-like protein